MMYDVAIVGGGPAGLMAARTAAALGLKTILFEKRKSVRNITRACCEQLIMDENFQGDTVRLHDGNIVSLKNEFTVPYSGPTVPIVDKYFISPSGKRIHFAYPDKRPIVIKIDKGLLLQTLWEQCCAAGVAMRPGVHIGAAKDTGDVIILTTAKGETFRSAKLVIAEGVNARCAHRLGINQDRQCLTTALCVIYFVKGIEGFRHSELSTYFGRAYRGLAPITITASLDDPLVACCVVIGNSTNSPERLFRNITTQGVLAPRFRNASVVRKTGCAARAYTPLRRPYRKNTLVIGDAAAYVEVEMQGAMSCGYRAAQAVACELNDNSGFDNYTQWWQQSFEFNGADFMQVAKGFALVPTYTDEELDYLFGLIEHKTLEGTYNQYKSPRLMWDAIMHQRTQIESERPSLWSKMTTGTISLKDML
ncbi:MAG: NAD(P)/FAD-dependent oxidoreductase [Desulfobacterota bacterium]|nr:NAD(P)/FAD-dependent oxidoreductase [Thermodesulfobacteriota bacterium]